MKKTTMIRENYLFRRLYHKGKSYVSSCVAVYCRKGGKGNRLGITTTKKIGKAVTRNRARRVILEAYRLLEDRVPSGWDFVIVARTRAAHVKMQVVQRELEGVFKKLGNGQGPSKAPHPGKKGDSEPATPKKDTE